MTIIKICGITDVSNGLVAIDAGADYLGFVFYPPSKRALDQLAARELIGSIRHQRPGNWLAVGVFVNEPFELVDSIQRLCGLDVVQLNGEEDPAYVKRFASPIFKSARYDRGTRPPAASFYGAARILLDANVPGEYGGTGQAYDWSEVGELVAEGFLAGGLTPTNVGPAILAANPWGVDVSSGVERDGKKDPGLIREFVAAVRQIDAERDAASLTPLRSGQAESPPSLTGGRGPLATRQGERRPQPTRGGTR